MTRFVLESLLMAVSRRSFLIAFLAALLLGGCAHSRVVSRDYDNTPRAAAHGSARPISHAATQPLPANALHVVRAGETLYGISFRYGLRYQDVAAWNGIGDPYTIEIGQRLRLRPVARGASAIAGNVPGQSRNPRVQSPSSNAQASPGLTGAIAAAPAQAYSRPAIMPAPGTQLPRPIPGATTPAAPASSSVPPAPTVTPGATPPWRWPTQGQIIGRYVAGDQTQQGINIAGSAGQNVVAAADGVVVYSGSGLVGYGELIIIKHSDEWLSAYAHNRRRLVGEGTRVRSGDTIAEMGRTGAARDMLHFEIRRNGKPVDPLALLPSH